MALSCPPPTTSVPLTLAHPTVFIDNLSQVRQLAATTESSGYCCCSILSGSETEKENDQIHAQYIQSSDIVRACRMP
jgi:hypothetical protein